MYSIRPIRRFKKELEKLIKSGRLTVEKFKKFYVLLQNDPYDSRLATHKVSSRNFGKKYSSKVDGDLRVIWDFDENEALVLLLLDIGGHEGFRGVY